MAAGKLTTRLAAPVAAPHRPLEAPEVATEGQGHAEQLYGQFVFKLSGVDCCHWRSVQAGSVLTMTKDVCGPSDHLVSVGEAGLLVGAYTDNNIYNVVKTSSHKLDPA